MCSYTHFYNLSEKTAATFPAAVTNDTLYYTKNKQISGHRAQTETAELRDMSVHVYPESENPPQNLASCKLLAFYLFIYFLI